VVYYTSSALSISSIKPDSQANHNSKHPVLLSHSAIFKICDLCFDRCTWCLAALYAIWLGTQENRHLTSFCAPALDGSRWRIGRRCCLRQSGDLVVLSPESHDVASKGGPDSRIVVSVCGWTSVDVATNLPASGAAGWNRMVWIVVEVVMRCSDYHAERRPVLLTDCNSSILFRCSAIESMFYTSYSDRNELLRYEDGAEP